MRKRILVIGSIALVALVLILGIVVPILADEPEPTPQPGRLGWFGGGWGCWGGGRWASFDVVAEALDLTPEELFAELRAGKTVADLAEERDVALDDIQDTIAASRKEYMIAEIERLVEEGTFSREQADWNLTGLEKGWLGSSGKAVARRGWGARGMRGRFGVPQVPTGSS